MPDSPQAQHYAPQAKNIQIGTSLLALASQTIIQCSIRGPMGDEPTRGHACHLARGPFYLTLNEEESQVLPVWYFFRKSPGPCLIPVMPTQRYDGIGTGAKNLAKVWRIKRRCEWFTYTNNQIWPSLKIWQILHKGKKATQFVLGVSP